MTLVMVFATLEYALCDSDNCEAGYEKIAIYGKGSEDDEYEHVARQLADGTWTSKLGPDDDINHPTLDSLAGGSYGKVLKIMKRKREESVS
jgi:hypothetical protein